MLKGLGDLFQAMKQAQAIQGRLGEVQSRLAELRAEGAAGGGMVQVTVDGQQRVISCKIEPSLLAAGDCEMLEELVCSAANQALDRVREAASGEMSSLMQGLDIPGLKDALGDFKFPGPAN